MADLTIEHVERAAGVTLLPWQREAAEGFIRGDVVAWTGGRRGGRFTWRRVMRDARALAAEPGDSESGGSR